jgi:steroid 5-alpha reductase family enzyme
MLMVWGISIPARDVSLIDLAWGLGFVLIAGATAACAVDPGPGAWLLVLATAVWGLRLSGYLAWRNLGHGEDRRYQAMRQAAGPPFWWRSLLTVFALQGAVMWVVSLPLQLGIAAGAADWSWVHLVGISLWGIGLLCESIGDWQLVRFRSDPANAGRVLDRGLWRYTRHPNYFGDFLVWWGLFLTAAADGRHLWTVVSPLLMSFLLLKVSGVALLERSLSSAKPGYADYVRRTSPFFPWPPRADSRTDA